MFPNYKIRKRTKVVHIQEPPNFPNTCENVL